MTNPNIGRSHMRRGRGYRPRRHIFGSSKNRESNFVAAITNMVVVVLICTALAEPHWFYLRGGGCCGAEYCDVNYLGMNQFIVSGQFTKVDGGLAYTYGGYHKETLKNCVTPEIVKMMHAILALCFLAILSSLFAFLLDLSGSTYKAIKFFREFAIFSIFSVFLCIVVNGFSYWVTVQLESLQQKTKPHVGSKVEIDFSVSFYLITAAGALSVISTAFDLLMLPSIHHNHRRSRRARVPYERLPSSVTSDDELLDIAEQVPTSAPPPYAP